MKKVVNISKRDLVIGDVKIKYLNSGIFEETKLSNYLRQRIKTFERLGFIRVFEYPEYEETTPIASVPEVEIAPEETVTIQEEEITSTENITPTKPKTKKKKTNEE